jgi:hypoxanthine phosphoribosyltransferase
VGYGIDFAQANRNLPYIGSVVFEDEPMEDDTVEALKEQIA